VLAQKISYLTHSGGTARVAVLEVLIDTTHDVGVELGAYTIQHMEKYVLRKRIKKVLVLLLVFTIS